MLPAAARMTRRVDFDVAVRRGRRAGRSLLVLHAARGEGPPKVGFVVSRAVGGSVVRHRVQRRLRHVMRSRLAALEPGTLLVVRALPAAASASSAELAADVDVLLGRVSIGDSR
jgi:ribonuclease P protein component